MKVGVLGAGQLGQMLALAGYPLGLRFRFFDPVRESPAAELGEFVNAAFSDGPALRKFAEALPLITPEFENIPASELEALAEQTLLLPPPQAFRKSQDRVEEKTFFNELGVGTALFRPVDDWQSAQAAVAELGCPSVLKTRRLGYDGKGQAVLRRPADLEAAWLALGKKDLILERFVKFERELSLIGVRGRNGALGFYPLIENKHRNGILLQSVAPSSHVTAALQSQAEAIGERALIALDYVGVLVIEFFVNGGELLVNEMAPRVHNSGHWTIEGAVTSQFENHWRALLGLPLGSTAMRGHAAMLNIVGAVPDTQALLAIPGAHLHLYGKAPRALRKLGHLTLCAGSRQELDTKIQAAIAIHPGWQ